MGVTLTPIVEIPAVVVDVPTTECQVDHVTWLGRYDLEVFYGTVMAPSLGSGQVIDVDGFLVEISVEAGFWDTDYEFVGVAIGASPCVRWQYERSGFPDGWAGYEIKLIGNQIFLRIDKDNQIPEGSSATITATAYCGSTPVGVLIANLLHSAYY